MNAQLTIKNRGRMWWVCCGKKVLAFASSYRMAEIRTRELAAEIEATRFDQLGIAR